MSLKVRVTEGHLHAKTVYVEGRLHNDTVAALDAELDKIVSSPATLVVLDLGGLEYISSAGLRSIFKLRKVMAARSGKTLLVNLRPQVHKVFEIANAVDFAEVFASVEELDRYLDAMQRKITDGN
jgi:anti-anti-sigma factor